MSRKNTRRKQLNRMDKGVSHWNHVLHPTYTPKCHECGKHHPTTYLVVGAFVLWLCKDCFKYVAEKPRPFNRKGWRYLKRKRVA